MATTVFPRPSASYAQVKIDKVANATNGNIPGLNAAGNLTDSGYAPDDLIEILEYANQSSFPASGESGKIYVALDTNLTYRWSGSAYVQTGNSLALGETSSTAYRGDRGAAAYAAAVTNVGGANLAAEAIIVPEYDATATYAVGSLRTHGGKLYTCNTAIETAEAWNSSHWTETSVDTVYAPKANPVFTGSISLGRTPTTNVGTRIGANSYAVGDGVRATQNNAHAEGYMTQAIAANAHAEGESTYAMATASHAEGHDAWAIGTYSHAEGYGTYANDSTSHAEGYGTDATGNYSHAEGYYTKAKGKSQHVSGEYNVEDTGTTSARGTYAEIIGNGTSSSARSNARTLDWSGNERLKGELYVGCDADSSNGTAVGAGLTALGNKIIYVNNTGDLLNVAAGLAVGEIKYIYSSPSATNTPVAHRGFSIASRAPDSENNIVKLDFFDATDGTVWTNTRYSGAWVGWTKIGMGAGDGNFASGETFLSILNSMPPNSFRVAKGWSLPSDKPSDASSNGDYNEAIFFGSRLTEEAYNHVILMRSNNYYIGKPNSTKTAMEWNELALNSKTDSNCKYLNDTSKTGLQLLQADFSTLTAGEIRFYRIRPSDSNLHGWFIKHTDDYGYGMFVGSSAGHSYQITYFNGTWSSDEFALKSQLTPVEYNQSSVMTLETGFEFFQNIAQHKTSFMAEISMEIKKTDSTAFSGNRVFLGTLSSGWKPKKQIVVPVSGNQLTTGYVNTIVGNMLIGTNGKINIDLVSNNTTLIHVCAAFLI